MQGDVVAAPDGTEVVLVGVGSSVVLDSPRVRVWDVHLPPHGRHPWHLHHNPYVVLSIDGSTGRMDWLDGSEPRHIREYTGGAVFRPVSPVHRLTETGGKRYRNRLVELKDLGENLAEVVDVGRGAQSEEGVLPDGTAPLPDGRRPVLRTDYVTVWTVSADPGTEQKLDLDHVPHVVARIDADLEDDELAESVTEHPGGPLTLENTDEEPRTWFVVALDYLEDR
ncbi:hypothetical protein [Actinotalea sp. Marseille-Q4924]|uniref:hypothetical protein n=1 Tax=Actinotalea sp. Marseille-Q4924 TaxID=2866571 RepID=UPI001CE479D9|nr:hypothetical protein [Actinotalea sp. Marseille-Q4924]